MEKLCVIFGGASSEHDISIITAMQLKKNYQAKRELEMIYMGLDNKFYLATKVEEISFFANKNKINLKEIYIIGNSIYIKGMFFKKYCDIECVINCCHGGVGENGDLAGFFSVNGVRYTSANALYAHIAMDKNLAKTLLENIVPTIKGVEINKEDVLEKSSYIEQEFSSELIVKPNSLGSSIGVKACDKSNYLEQVMAIFELGDTALVEERVVDIVEYNQACFRDGDKLVLSVIENPLTKSEFLTFEDKYSKKEKTKGGDRIIPAKINKDLEAQINLYTEQIFRALNMNGVVRIDYIFDSFQKDFPKERQSVLCQKAPPIPKCHREQTWIADRYCFRHIRLCHMRP